MRSAKQTVIIADTSGGIGPLEAGIEWIVARELAPLQDELLRLRATVEALREAVRPW